MKSTTFNKSRISLLPQLCIPACWALIWLLGQPGWGQENPFGAAGGPDDPPPAVTADGEKGELSEYDKLVAAEKDPLVRSILEAKPTSPEDWIQDVRMLLNLKRVEFAKEYLTQFLAVAPSDAELAKIHARFGSALFIRLSNTPGLQPEGAAVADAVMIAASDQMKNAANLVALVDRVNDSDPATRRSALIELTKAGSAAAVPMIAVLGDGSRKSDHPAIQTALVSLGDEAVGPLIATLMSPNQELRLQAMTILGDLNSLKAVPFVLLSALSTDQDPSASETARKMLQDALGGVPSPEEATRFLKRRMENFLAGSAPGPVDQDDQVTVWIWDISQQIPRQETLAATDASFLAAALLAEQLHGIDVDNAEFDRMYLATALEVAKRLNGYGRPLTEDIGPIYADASAASTDRLEEVLELALAKKMQGAAVAAIDLLGKTKNADLLRSDDGHPRLVTRALNSPMGRVKYAAARAVMFIDPTSSYPGSSYLSGALGYMSSGGGTRRVLIGHPRADAAQRLAGLFSVLGFAADSQQTGRELALQAFSSADYSLVLIHDAIDRPGYRELVQILRKDRRTADLPVGLMVREINQDAAQSFANTDRLTLAFAPPHTQEDVAYDTRRLLAILGRGQVLPDERVRHASFALDALAQLAADEDKYDFYDLLPLDTQVENVLSTPALAAKAAAVLGLLGTPKAQRALVGFASTQMQPLADRQAAATALRTAVTRRGLLLTRDQLMRQYDIYNASESLGSDTQQVLATILDAIEAPSRASTSGKNDD